MNLLLANNQRKYLNGTERDKFKTACLSLDRESRIFALMLYHTGCRISEAINLNRGSIDLSSGVVHIETLKRRSRGVMRSIPLPENYIQSIDDVYDIRLGKKKNTPLFGVSRSTGWRIIQKVMAKANIEGEQACPKGLRHGFAVACVESNIPITILRRWMGHASLESTAVYLNLNGKEDRDMMERLWN